MIPHLIICDKHTLVPDCCIEPVPEGHANQNTTIKLIAWVQVATYYACTSTLARLSKAWKEGLPWHTHQSSLDPVGVV
jgi:hypothetical protein